MSSRKIGSFTRLGDASTAHDPILLSTLLDREAILGRKVDYVHSFWSWNRPFSELQIGVDTGVYGGTSGRQPLVSLAPAGSGTINGIIAGSWDTYIDASAAWCSSYQTGNPSNPLVTIRFGYEMNGNWSNYSSQGSGGNTAAQYVTAWRYIVDRFRVTNGVTNTRWFWGANESDFPDVAGNHMEDYWPGSGYVDVIGYDAYNFGGDSVVRTWDSWKTFTTIMYPYARVAAIDATKPIWLGEFGSAEYTFTNSTNTPDSQNPSITSKALWVADAYANTGFPRLEVLVYFDQDSTTESGVIRNWKYDSSVASSDAFTAALGS